jgi:hypothetical protein
MPIFLPLYAAIFVLTELFGPPLPLPEARTMALYSGSCWRRIWFNNMFRPENLVYNRLESSCYASVTRTVVPQRTTVPSLALSILIRQKTSPAWILYSDIDFYSNRLAISFRVVQIHLRHHPHSELWCNHTPWHQLDAWYMLGRETTLLCMLFVID